MRETPKTELSPDNGCVIDKNWKLGTLSYHACGVEANESVASKTAHERLPEIVIFDHVGFGGASARTNLSFLDVGDFWNDRMSSVIVVSGVWRFYKDGHYQGEYWELGPGLYECFFSERGPDDVISSFKAVALT